MKVLVTGCAGYVGSSLVPKILAEGHEVRGVDALLVSDEGLEKIKDRIEFTKGDLRDSSLLSRIVRGVDAVIHLAAISTDPAGKSFARETFEINTEATEELARAAKAAGAKRFLFASSGSVYHAIPCYEKTMTEEDELSPQSAYSLSKFVAEEKLLSLADKNFYPLLLRKATIYGLSPRMRYDIEINTYTRDAATDGVITILEGKIKRPFLDIEDACAIYLKALAMPLTRQGVGRYNVVTMNVIMREVAERIVKITGALSGGEIVLRSIPAGHFRAYWMSDEKIKKTFHFSPRRPFEDAIKEMWDDAKKRKDPKSARYDNYKWMLAEKIFG